MNVIDWNKLEIVNNEFHQNFAHSLLCSIQMHVHELPFLT